MIYVLDTDVLIWVLRGKEPIFSRVRELSPADLAITTMSEAELRYGALNSSDPARNLARVEAFLTGPVESLAFGRDAARSHAEIRHALHSHPIGERDLVIASIALVSGGILVTGNSREFARVSGLAVEDWIGSKRPPVEP